MTLWSCLSVINIEENKNKKDLSVDTFVQCVNKKQIPLLKKENSCKRYKNARYFFLQYMHATTQSQKRVPSSTSK